MLAEEQPAQTVLTKQAESRSFAGARLAAAAGSARAAQDDNSLLVLFGTARPQSLHESKHPYRGFGAVAGMLCSGSAALPIIVPQLIACKCSARCAIWSR